MICRVADIHLGRSRGSGSGRRRRRRAAVGRQWIPAARSSLSYVASRKPSTLTRAAQMDPGPSLEHPGSHVGRSSAGEGEGEGGRGEGEGEAGGDRWRRQVNLDRRTLPPRPTFAHFNSTGASRGPVLRPGEGRHRQATALQPAAQPMPGQQPPAAFHEPPPPPPQ